jgi:hypothetical protein
MRCILYEKCKESVQIVLSFLYIVAFGTFTSDLLDNCNIRRLKYTLPKSVEHLWWSDFRLIEYISNAGDIHIRVEIYLFLYARGYLSNLRKFRPLREVYLRYKSEYLYRKECHGWVSKTSALYLKWPGFGPWEWLSWFVLCFSSKQVAE